MVRRVLPLVLFSVCLTISACGDKAPSAPTVVGPSSVTVSSTSDLLFIGASETFTGTATFAATGAQPLTGATWGTDAPDTVTVEAATGRVTGKASGQATVFADLQGARGTRLVRVLPNYQGAWSGGYSVDTCTESGDAIGSNICVEVFQVGRVLPVQLLMTQTRDAVAAQTFLGTIAGAGTGPVQSDGMLLLASTSQTGGVSEQTAWRLVSSQPGRATGTMTIILRVSGASGEVRVGSTIHDLMRDSAPTARPQVPAAGNLHGVARLMTRD